MTIGKFVMTPALESAQKGLVLLKNNGILPLAKTATKKRILVTGPNANNQTILGDWHAVQPDENVITIFEGIETLGTQKGYEVSFFDSGENIRKIKDTKIQSAAQTAVDYFNTFKIKSDQFNLKLKRYHH